LSNSGRFEALAAPLRPQLTCVPLITRPHICPQRQKELLTPAEAAAAAFGDVIGDDKLPEAQQRRRLPSTRGAAAAVQQQIGGLGGAFTRVR
jgi:hypothetical protein